MTKLKALLLILPVMFFGSGIMAEESSLELATERGCFICHSLQRKSGETRPLAPSYQEIAERYRADKGAFQYLVNRILHGTLYTEQNWSDDISMRFMPPNVNVSRLEAGELVNWIFELPEDRALRERLERHENMLVLSTRSGCTACHLMESNSDARLMPLAPAFRDIARRYRGEAGAEEKLLRSIVHGTRAASKTWQNVNMQFMPPNVGLERAAAEQLAQWILELE